MMAASLMVIQESENIMQARKEKQTNKVPQERGSRVQKESIDESEV